MDSITHTMMGASLYAATDKQSLTKRTKVNLLITSLIASNIPDSDIISQLWDTEGMYQMWHRGITHSIFMVPIWAGLLWLFSYLIFKNSDKKFFIIPFLSVFIHISLDALNTWGTGLFEPFSSLRVSLGVIPIVDFVIWGILFVAFWWSKRKGTRRHFVFRTAWLLIGIHVVVQSITGYIVYQSVAGQYEQHVLAADFIPGSYKIIGKNEGVVDIVEAAVWQEPELIEQLSSDDDVELTPLFRANKEARTLYEWSPFVVIKEHEKGIEIFDPRFYRDGTSFLTESMYR